MQPIATDGVEVIVMTATAIDLLVTFINPAKMAELEMRWFWEADSCGSKELSVRLGAYWRHLANMMDRSMQRRQCDLSLALL